MKVYIRESDLTTMLAVVLVGCLFIYGGGVWLYLHFHPHGWMK